MPCQNERLRAELLALVADDRRVREDLVQRGALHEGYHPEMEVVHVESATRLKAILSEYGWPTPAQVDDDGAEAAWLVVQHAIGDPSLQRRCLQLLRSAAVSERVPSWQAAMLEDRIRMFEGKPQVYGTQLETEADGTVRPYRLEDPDGVEARRRSVGLEPLGVRLAREKPSPLPADPERFEQEFQAWLRRVGWRP